MAAGVIAAFAQFMQEKVNLDADETVAARRSREWLAQRIHELPARQPSFPKLHDGMDVFFGAYERKTKKRPLDDVAIMVCMAADGARYKEHGAVIWIETDAIDSPLHALRHDDSKFVNSRRVINKFVEALAGVPQYKKSAVGRQGAAAVLELHGYAWLFDIVPCFYAGPDAHGEEYYIVPDGNGHWKKTDPRKDRARVQRLEHHKGTAVLNLIRLVKYWNRRPSLPSLPSYTLENMILDRYENAHCSDFPDLALIDFLGHMRSAVYDAVADPKGLQGDLNQLSIEEKIELSMRCSLDYDKCVAARRLEMELKYRQSMQKWREVLGPGFPAFQA